MTLAAHRAFLSFQSEDEHFKALLLWEVAVQENTWEKYEFWDRNGNFKKGRVFLGFLRDFYHSRVPCEFWARLYLCGKS